MSFDFRTDDRGGVTLVLDERPQSYVDPHDPGLLTFEYMQHIALVLDTLPPGPLAVTHVGGAALTLPRWLHHERPGSPQIVLEPDAALTEAVRRELPLPRGHRIRVRPQDGRAGLTALAPESADAVIVDAYADGRVPADLVTVECAAVIAKVLKPQGIALFNLADEPDRAWLRRALRGLSQPFSAHAVLATAEVMKKKRFGNYVLAVSNALMDAKSLRRKVAGAPLPTGLLLNAEVDRLIAGARPFDDTDTVPSPRPPAVGWRIR
ncbi:hypothetical protein G9U51_06715 [Calidifontibacter sp. DB0510]|uniref:Spermidine synthase n=1 Tax=Metallococcus carri TaxID=1656884 RepID=A0A967B137_9MICO|nr:fused MFS/spermidine synthase [Metallococcus carri]NHN55475.1 hypothetical protein [Metallococcus carri]NOP38341.1 fused MFS/spermidine synthase [Calidifontibacter sp. DB2511S]